MPPFLGKGEIYSGHADSDDDNENNQNDDDDSESEDDFDLVNEDSREPTVAELLQLSTEDDSSDELELNAGQQLSTANVPLPSVRTIPYFLNNWRQQDPSSKAQDTQDSTVQPMEVEPSDEDHAVPEVPQQSTPSVPNEPNNDVQDSVSPPQPWHLQSGIYLALPIQLPAQAEAEISIYEPVDVAILTSDGTGFFEEDDVPEKFLPDFPAGQAQMEPVSRPPSNDDMVTSLVRDHWIVDDRIERAFREVDRGMFVPEEQALAAYLPQIIRSGMVDMFEPLVYAELFRLLELEPGKNFLYVGSGTGYLNMLAGMIIGKHGINHGMDKNVRMVEYAQRKLQAFLKDDIDLDNFCEPTFFAGDGLSFSSEHIKYDRVLVGAGSVFDGSAPGILEYSLKINGVLLHPIFVDGGAVEFHHVCRIDDKTFHNVTIIPQVPMAFSMLDTEPAIMVSTPPLLKPKSLLDRARDVIRKRLRRVAEQYDPKLMSLERYKVEVKERRYQRMVDHVNEGLIKKRRFLPVCHVDGREEEDGDYCTWDGKFVDYFKLSLEPMWLFVSLPEHNVAMDDDVRFHVFTSGYDVLYDLNYTSLDTFKDYPKKMMDHDGLIPVIHFNPGLIGEQEVVVTLNRKRFPYYWDIYCKWNSKQIKLKYRKAVELRIQSLPVPLLIKSFLNFNRPFIASQQHDDSIDCE